MFRRALVRLTVTYTIVQLVLFAAFAVGIYIFVTGTFDLTPLNRTVPAPLTRPSRASLTSAPACSCSTPSCWC
ncbi:hypothetical protein SAMN05216274_103253 [Cryobacterium levicorallinum]|uniref:Uncharacterized protein n=1 Tax=Cryobacterium levicorallinum TaxID=995038 RepID=A0ABY1EBC6_9MICO|nr:hypothetical protein SAMN05216274_103253 [Cryobacterium levicorallinum]